MSAKIYLLLDNVRSSHNVGSLLRTAEGLGIYEVILCGITPYPKLLADDERPPYLADKISRRIAKTALGAETTQKWRYAPSATQVIAELKALGVEVVALEQAKQTLPLQNYRPQGDVALILGNEIEGVSQELLTTSDKIVEIPMSGQKESFNVSSAGAMALFYLTLML